MISRIFTFYSKGAASARRVEEVLTARGAHPVPAPVQKDQSAIRFRDVRFSYNKVHTDLGR